MPSYTEQQLWVDKYAPSKFTDLTSNDKTNVEVLKWVAQWKGGPKGFPDKKIMLISGPPGLGKTTLVQIVAKVSGYNLVEINASDERSGDALLQKITTAIESNGLRAQPNLVLLDEIDGAASTSSDQGLIKFLIKLASKDKASKDASGGGAPKDDSEEDDPEDDGARQGGGRRPQGHRAKPRHQRAKPQRQLARPILCVCNDMYAPALKALRQVAYLVQLKCTAPVGLARRLRHICDSEGLKMDGKGLIDLCDLMECDLRACLHALQFLSSNRTQISGTKELARCLESGLKDMAKSGFSILHAVFHPSAHNSLTTAELLQHTSKDEARVIEGCHDYYLQSRFFDDAQLSKVNQALDWLIAADLMVDSTYSGHVAPKFRQLFGAPSPAPMGAFTKTAAFEANQRRKANEATLAAYTQGLSRAGRSCPEEVLLTRIPLLQQIIKPSIRAPNPQLLKPGERLSLAKIVQVMVTEGLSFCESNGTVSLDPPIDRLVQFQAEPQPAQASQHEMAVRKMIAHEIQQESIRRLQKNVPDQKGSLRTLPKPKDVSKAVRRDFFGRVVVTEEPVASEHEAAATQGRVWYRFNEGFSNAVRRSVRISDLFS